MCVLFAKDPEVPVTVNVAVTPAGRPEATRATSLENPPTSVTVMVVATEPPWVTVRLLGEADSVKPPARALIRVCPFGVPHPVTRS